MSKKNSKEAREVHLKNKCKQNSSKCREENEMLRDEKKHSRVFRVNFRDVDQQHQLRMSSLVDFMQETANEHAQLLGFDFTNLKGEQAYYWIISRAKMQLDDVPKWQDNIRIETYPAGTDGLFSMRCFHIYNAQDKQIGYILGNYILMDGQTHCPVRMRNLKGKLSELEWQYEGEILPKLKAPITQDKLDQRTVRSGDIDSNAHMNNAHYIRWSTDMLSSEELKKDCIKGIQTNYVKALIEGDTVKIIRGKDEEGNISIQGISLDDKHIYWTTRIVMAVDRA